MIYPVKIKIEKISKSGTLLKVFSTSNEVLQDFNKFNSKNILTGELHIDDGRKITSEQRRKVYATINDIANFLGYLPEELKEIMKYQHIANTGVKYFSLGNCSVTTARKFINTVIDFALLWNIPLVDKAIYRTDDIDSYLYSCLKHKRCAVCGKDGEIHHEDTIGMGNDRTKIDDSKHKKICLCRVHHSEAHLVGILKFTSEYHIYGIVFL